MANDQLQSESTTPATIASTAESLTQHIEHGLPKNDKDTIAELYEKTRKLQVEIEKHEKSIGWLNTLTIFGFIVLLIMVAGMVVQSWSERSASYNDLLKQVYSLQQQPQQQKRNTVSPSPVQKTLSELTSTKKP